MPGIDGWAVLDRLKHHPDTRHIPVHIITGIRERQLHIFTHPEMKALVTMRAEDIAAGLPLRDMFGNRPA